MGEDWFDGERLRRLGYTLLAALDRWTMTENHQYQQRREIVTDEHDLFEVVQEVSVEGRDTTERFRVLVERLQ